MSQKKKILSFGPYFVNFLRKFDSFPISILIFEEVKSIISEKTLQRNNKICIEAKFRMRHIFW